MENKRGSHIGVIASFVIFVTFLVGILFVIEPMLKTQKNNDLLVESLEAQLKEKFSSNFTKIIMSNCSNCTLLDLNNLTIPSNSQNYIVKNKNGDILNSSYDLVFNYVFFNGYGEKILWAYVANVYFTLIGALPSGGQCSRPTIESVRVSKEIFQQKIIDNINNFENLKTNLSLPSNRDFSFTFEMDNKTQINAGKQNVSVEIYAREFPIQYIDKYANTLSGKLIIRVW